MRDKVLLYRAVLWQRAAALMVVLFLGIAAHAAASITAEPDVLVFHNTTQAETLHLHAADRVLPGSAVTSWQLLVDTRNYSHMLLVTPVENGLRVTPSDTVEIGSYVLVLHTAHGEARVQVFTPLSEHESLIESLARRMNVDMAEVRAQMGISQRLGREQISLNVRPVHYWGQRLVIEMPTSPGRVSLWKINGDTVERGVDANRLEHPLSDLGPVLIQYEEWENDTRVASASALTEVVRQPAINYETTVNATVAFQAPTGFSRYSWRIDDDAAGSTSAFEHRFDAPGTYTVRVLCEAPVAPGPYHAREVAYQVTVANP